jgi:transposase
MLVTYKYRIKDTNRKTILQKMASHTNYVWNYSNEYIKTRWKTSRKYTSKFDIHPLTKGASSLLDINSQTIQAISEECVTRTKKAKKNLRFRSSKKNLGWIPFKGQTIKYCGDYIVYNGTKFRFWEHRKLPEGAKIKSGSFNVDARDRWYLNLAIEIPDVVHSPDLSTAVGIDPGVKTVLTTSEGVKYERESFTKKYQEKLAKAQRHKKKRQVKKINAKIKNSRLDWNHKVTKELSDNHDVIFFGDVSSKKLAKTNLAKGVLDASWYQMFMFLQYKTLRRGGIALQVSEKFSTCTCSTCYKRTGPSGLSGLSIREWKCVSCGAVHDRDINSALNILRFGHETLRELILGPKGSPHYSACA